MTAILSGKKANFEYIMFCVQFLLHAQSNPKNRFSFIVPLSLSPPIGCLKLL